MSNADVRGVASELVQTIPAPLGIAKHGQVKLTGGIDSIPLIEGSFIILKAQSANSGNAYLGSDKVTVPTSATNETTGYELRPGEASPYLPFATDSRYCLIGTSGDYVSYLIF